MDTTKTNSKRIRLVCFFLCLCISVGSFISLPAHAQESLELSLPKAIEMAQKDAKVWKEFDAKATQAQTQLKLAESHWWPIVSMDASMIGWSHENKIDVLDKEHLKQTATEAMGTLDASTQQMVSMFMPAIQTMATALSDELPESIVLKKQFTTTIGASVMMPLTPLFKVYHATKLAQIGIDNVDVERRAKQIAITYEVTDVYLKLVYAQLMTDVAQEALDTITKHVELAEKYENVGMIRHTDVLAAKVEQVKAKQHLVEARNATKLAGMKLSQVLGLERNTPIHASDMPKSSYSVSLESLEHYQDKALSQRTELQRIELGQKAAEKKHKMALLDYIPQVMLIGRYQFNYGIEALYPKNQAFIGLGMTWTIFDGLGHKYEAELAEQSGAELAAKDSDARELIALEVSQKYLALSTALERVSFTEEAVKLAEENLKTINALFEQGESVNTDVLAAQTRQSSAKADNVKARIDILAAHAELLLSLGEDPILDASAFE